MKLVLNRDTCSEGYLRFSVVFCLQISVCIMIHARKRQQTVRQYKILTLTCRVITTSDVRSRDP